MKTKYMIHDSRTRFSETVINYDVYRPSYPKKLIDWITEVTKITLSSKIADIGCGTGISTRLFAEKGFDIIGVDPNEDMLAYAIGRNGNVRYRKGDAEQTGLPGHTIDIIISAQAFHWFDFPKTMEEFKRILKKSGFCCASWNIREKTSFLKAYNEVLKKFSKDYEKTPKAEDTIIAIKNNEKVTNIKEAKFSYTQNFNLKGLVGRSYSTSYVVKGVKDHKAFQKSLKELFERYQSKGKIEFRYKTTVICWQFT